MAPNERLTRALDRGGVRYETLPHREAFTAQEVAAASHVPGGELAKVVLVRDEEGRYLMVVLPAPCTADLAALEAASGTRGLVLASEDELARLFPDSEVGAMPPFGRLYGLPTYVDACFQTDGEVVFQPGNHHEVVRMRYADYERLAAPVAGEFCVHARRARAGAGGSS